MTHEYLKQILEEFPTIRCHEEDDLEWWNEGLDYLYAVNFKEAEKKFKMLTLSQPEHLDGFRGLSMVYEKMCNFQKARFFVNIALEKAKQGVITGMCDPFFVEDIEADQKRIDAHFAKL